MATRKTVLITKLKYRQAGYSRGLILIHLAIDTVLRNRLAGVPQRLKLTAGSNGRHSPKGAHYAPRFEGCDLESKPIRRGAGFPAEDNKRHFLGEVMWELGIITLSRANDTKIFTADYFGWLEGEGTRREHFHFQVRKGHTIGL